MPRAIWSGSISFGLVNIPVKVFSATRDHTVHFHQIDSNSGSRIRYEKVAEKTGKEVKEESIELGYEVDKGKLVVVDPAELQKLRPSTTRTIDITDFVDLTEVDPVFYNKTYWLGPDGESAARPYRLLHEAMVDRGRVGIGMVVMRNKQYLAAIRPREGALALSTMRFADEVLPASDIDSVGKTKGPKPDAKELRLATQIVDSLSGPWKPDSYKDSYTDEVKRLIKAHEKGKDLVVEEAPAQKAEMTDLMAALQASLDAAKGKGDRAKALAKAAEALSEEDEDEPKRRHRRRSPAKSSSEKKKQS